MSKIIRLSESELIKLVKRIIEQERFDTFDEYYRELETILDYIATTEYDSEEYEQGVGQILQLARMAELEEDLSEEEIEEFLNLVEESLNFLEENSNK